MKIIIIIFISVTSLFPQNHTILDLIKNFELREDWKISDQNTNKFIFVAPSMMALNDSLYLYILDYGEKNIKIFDSNGKYIKSFGRKGKGPGEFIAPLSMVFNSKNELIVYDFILRRFSTFSANGNLIGTQQFSGDLYRFDIGPHDEFYIETRDIIPKKSNLIITKVKLYLFSPNLSKKIIIDSTELMQDTFIREPRPMKIPIAFCSDYLWKINASGELLSIKSTENNFKIFINGKLTKRNTYNGFSKIKVKAKDKDQFLSELAISFNGTKVNNIPPVIRNNIIFKKYKPFVKFILSMNDLFVLQSYNIQKGKADYYFFNEDGVYLDKLVLSTKLYGFNSIVIDKYLYSMITDSLGNKIIRRYQYVFPKEK